MIHLKSDLVTFLPERLISDNESLVRTLFPSHDADAASTASLVFGHLNLSSKIKFSSSKMNFKDIIPVVKNETKNFRAVKKAMNRPKKTTNLSLSNGRMGKWMSSRRKDHKDLTNGEAVII